jgi:hypothetical protein
MKNLLIFYSVFILALGTVAKADGLLSPPTEKHLKGLPKQILLGPIYKERYFCSQHTATSWNLGDSLGADCIISSVWGDGYPKFYRTDGKKNEDWYGWHADVLAPIDGKVVGTFVNNVENTPGTFGKGQASAIQLLTSQNQIVILVHVTKAFHRVLNSGGRWPLVDDGAVHPQRYLRHEIAFETFQPIPGGPQAAGAA